MKRGKSGGGKRKKVWEEGTTREGKRMRKARGNFQICAGSVAVPMGLGRWEERGGGKKEGVEQLPHTPERKKRGGGGGRRREREARLVFLSASTYDNKLGLKRRVEVRIRLESQKSGQGRGFGGWMEKQNLQLQGGKHKGKSENRIEGGK